MKPNLVILAGGIACLACTLILYLLHRAGDIRTPATSTTWMQLIFVSLLLFVFAFTMPAKRG